MAWIEVHQSLPDHRKVLSVADRLDLPEVYVVGHLVTFWLWALDNVQDGSLAGVTPRMIARAAHWQDDPATFTEALVDAGLLDLHEDGYWIHDWPDYAGRLIDRRAAERERSRQRRAAAKQPSSDQQTTGGRPAVDQQTAVGTVPNPTVPPLPNGNASEPPPPDDEEAETKPAKPVRASRDDLRAMWRAFAEITGQEPAADGERGKWNGALRELWLAGIRADGVPRLIGIYRDRYGPAVDCNPRAVANNLSTLQRANAPPSQAVEDVYPAFNLNGDTR